MVAPIAPGASQARIAWATCSPRTAAIQRPRHVRCGVSGFRPGSRAALRHGLRMGTVGLLLAQADQVHDGQIGSEPWLRMPAERAVRRRPPIRRCNASYTVTARTMFRVLQEPFPQLAVGRSDGLRFTNSGCRSPADRRPLPGSRRSEYPHARHHARRIADEFQRMCGPP